MSGEYHNKTSILEVFCEKHGVKHTTTFTNYTRSKYGMPCCGKKAVSDKLASRQYSPESIQRMRESAYKRIKKNKGTGQYWRRTTEYRKWERAVRLDWKSQCGLTGRQQNLVCHHFYSGSRVQIKEKSSWVSYPQNVLTVDPLLESQRKSKRLRYDRMNGIILYAPIHKDFHKRFGYENNTLKDFRAFLKQLFIEMSISSQTYQEWWEGSETKAHHLVAVMRLDKRLEKIAIGLPD